MVNRTVPIRKLTLRSRAFWSDEIGQLVAKRRRCLRRFRRYKTLKAKADYTLANRKAREAIRTAKSAVVRAQAEFLANASRGEVYRRYRRITSRPQNPLPVLKVGNRILRNRKEQADALSYRFSTLGEERADDDFDGDFKAGVDRAIASHNFNSERERNKRG